MKKEVLKQRIHAYLEAKRVAFRCVKKVELNREDNDIGFSGQHYIVTCSAYGSSGQIEFKKFAVDVCCFNAWQREIRSVMEL